MFFSAVLQAVKKGPNARGGLLWKTHAFFKVSKTRKKNVLKKLKIVNANTAVLKEAAALELAQRSGAQQFYTLSAASSLRGLAAEALKGK